MAINGDQHRYAAFGTVITSEIPLSDFLSHAPADTTRTTTELTVSLGSLPHDPTRAALSDTKVYEDRSERYWIHRLSRGFIVWYRGVGSLFVETDEITVSPHPAADRDSIEWLVTNLGLRLAFVARGAVVFHASAAIVDDALVSFAGPSGRGKSTLAAACYATGHLHHSDDLVPVFTPTEPDVPLVSPGPPRLRINTDVVPSLEPSPSHPEFDGEKALSNTSSRHSTRSRDMDVLYLVDDADRIDIAEVPTQDAVFEILRRSYALYRDSDTDSARTHFQRCSELARSIGVRRLSRPRSLPKLPEVVRAIEADVSD